MKGILVTIGILLVAVLGFGGIIISGLNRAVRLDEGANFAWSEVDNQLKRRNDLIPNLVETVKGYAKHEKELLTHIADARARLAGAPAGLNKEKISAASNMDGLLARLLVVVENYPNLKANENFSRMMDELAGTENRIAVARQRYNDAARIFNTFSREVLGSMFAKAKGLGEPKPYYEVAEAEKAVPQVKF